MNVLQVLTLLLWQLAVFCCGSWRFFIVTVGDFFVVAVGGFAFFLKKQKYRRNYPFDVIP